MTGWGRCWRCLKYFRLETKFGLRPNCKKCMNEISEIYSINSKYLEKIREILILKFGDKCLMCNGYNYRKNYYGTKKLKIALCVDHVIPLSRNGSNNLSNLQLLCHPCNNIKRTEIIDLRKDLTTSSSICYA